MNTMMFFKTAFLTLTMLNAFTLTKLASASEGGESGGGGDASEARVNEIRSDILNWINKGGASGLKLSFPLSHYEEEMKKILQNKVATLSFTGDKVEVSGKEKTCRGFFENNKPQILCNIVRFEKTKEADQYRLIHHEYAGLAGLERNEEAASDYEISNQLTDFLNEEKILRLSVKNKNQFDMSIPRKQLNFTLTCSLEGKDGPSLKLKLEMNTGKIQKFNGSFLNYKIDEASFQYMDFSSGYKLKFKTEKHKRDMICPGLKRDFNVRELSWHEVELLIHENDSSSEGLWFDKVEAREKILNLIPIGQNHGGYDSKIIKLNCKFE